MENCLLSCSSFLTLTWDEKHTKALLRLHRYPLRLIQVDPWQSWIESRGGVEHVLNHLRNTPLPHDQEQIFNIILAHPYASAWIYYNKLNISPSTYFFRLKNLIRTLLLRLNTWKVEQPNALLKPTITTNLPSILTRLIGAEKSLANVVASLRQPSTRLLTLTGPGGVGKTRLAIAVGTAMLENFESGVFFVPLETINDPALLVTQIARSLNMETIGVEPLLEALKSYLSERQMLLILDNFEQLIQAGPTVTDLLQTAGNIKVLVTSREPLNLYGEVCFTVPELIGPSSGQTAFLGTTKSMACPRLVRATPAGPPPRIYCRRDQLGNYRGHLPATRWAAVGHRAGGCTSQVTTTQPAISSTGFWAKVPSKFFSRQAGAAKNLVGYYRLELPASA